MDFDKRKLEYDRLISQNTIFLPTCKVCLTVELLKQVMCPNGCQIEIQPEKQLIFDRILSDLQPNSPEEVLINTLQQQFNIHQQGIKYEQEIQDIKEKFNAFKQNVSNIIKEEIQNIMKKVLDQEQSLDLLQYQQKSDKKDFKQDLEKLNQDVTLIHQKLSEQTDKLARLSMKNDPGLKLKSIEQSQQEINKFNERMLNELMDKQDEIQQKQSEFMNQLTDIQSQQLELKKQNQEMKKVALHSSNLVTAADSVFSAHQEMKNFEKRTSFSLEEMRTEIETLKKTLLQANQLTPVLQPKNFQTKDIENLIDSYQNQVEFLQNQQREIKNQSENIKMIHPGNLAYDSNLRQICWSCCRRTNESKGCIPEVKKPFQ